MVLVKNALKSGKAEMYSKPQTNGSRGTVIAATPALLRDIMKPKDHANSSNF